ncbi:MAG: serine/threonine protein kinase, partial [Kofleriaceae bacterium]
MAADLAQAFDALLQVPRERIDEREKFTAVKQLEFFVGFPDAEIWEIVRAGQWNNYRNHAEIILEGELDDSFY